MKTEESLRSGLIRLAHANPNFRSEILPLLKEAFDGGEEGDSSKGKGGLNPLMIEYKKKQQGRTPYRNPDTGKEVGFGSAMKNPKLKQKALQDFKSWASKQKEDTGDELAEKSKKWDKGEEKTRGRKYDQGKRTEKFKKDMQSEADKSKKKEKKKEKKPSIDFSKATPKEKKSMKWLYEGNKESEMDSEKNKKKNQSDKLKKAMVHLAYTNEELRPYLLPLIREASSSVEVFLSQNAHREIATTRGALTMASDLVDHLGLPASTDNLKKLSRAFMSECHMTGSCALSVPNIRKRIARTIENLLGM